jgi:predicted glycoside hydrolase/deacetylase ChbG (UPF0249 family)
MYTEPINLPGPVNTSGRYLIVNADDFGYYDCVSKGILSAAETGAVTATGIFANSPFLDTHLSWLKRSDSLDTGVHLNLTDRSPLTSAMRARLHRSKGCFPGKFVMARWILTGRISLEVVAQELRSQIEHCLAAGVALRFLNSHEHIHMLPPVFRITQDLAMEYGIPHVRYALPDSLGSLAPGELIRDIALHLLGRRNHKQLRIPTLPFIGMAASGKLNLDYLRRRLLDLAPGAYELMCHPGTCADEDVPDAALRAYHEWGKELDVLTSNEFRALCRQKGISLIGYRHLKVDNGQIEFDIDSQEESW